MDFILNLVQSQNLEIVVPSKAIQSTIFACCDFIAQSILVRTTDNTHHLLHSSTNCSKDISLLDCVGLQHSCCDCSLILSIGILRSINLFSFTDPS